MFSWGYVLYPNSHERLYVPDGDGQRTNAICLARRHNKIYIIREQDEAYTMVLAVAGQARTWSMV